MIDFQNNLLSIIAILLTIIVAVTSAKNRLKQIFFYIQHLYYIIRFKKLKSLAGTLLNRKTYITPILDEMIGYYESSHIGLYVFHNGVVDINNNHLYKLSMVDERSRYFSIIRENQNIPLNIFSDIILGCLVNDYYELHVATTDIIYLKEEIRQLPSVNFVYYSIYCDNGIPQFMLSICTNKELSQEEKERIFTYRTTIKKIIKYELEETKYSKLDVTGY